MADTSAPASRAVGVVALVAERLPSQISNDRIVGHHEHALHEAQ